MPTYNFLLLELSYEYQNRKIIVVFCVNFCFLMLSFCGFLILLFLICFFRHFIIPISVDYQYVTINQQDFKKKIMMVVGACIFLIAAAQALPPEVYVRIRKTPEEYLISVRNRVQEDLLLEEGKLPGTTKKESGHGMGLANVQDVLRKYGAEYTVSCRDRWFRFTCAIPCAVHDMSTDNL